MEQVSDGCLLFSVHAWTSICTGYIRETGPLGKPRFAHIVAEISVAEPDSFEIRYLVKRWYSFCCQPALILRIPVKDNFFILGFLRQGLQQLVVICRSALI